jgi:Methyltransferase domain
VEKAATDSSTAAFDRSLRSLDLRLFDQVKSQSGPQDRLSLLALHNACREHYGEFSYLEIGSHLGGSLQVCLADDRCRSIVSIDSRPERQPDVRGVFEYPDNTTARMLDHLKSVPRAQLGKLHTIDASTEAVSLEDLPAQPQLCFIDAEHTVEAALRDARFCQTAIGGDGAIAFHDRRLVRPAIERFLDELGEHPHEGYPLLGSVYVVELGETRLRPRAEELLAGHGETKPFLVDYPARKYPRTGPSEGLD